MSLVKYRAWQRINQDKILSGIDKFDELITRYSSGHNKLHRVALGFYNGTTLIAEEGFAQAPE